MSQNRALIKHLKSNRRGITQMEAFTVLGVCRLSERIRELEASGYVLIRIREEGTNRHGNAIRYVRYKLVK